MVSDNTSSPARAYGCGQDVPWPSTPAPVAVGRRSERKLGSAASESTWSLPQIGPRTSLFDPPVSHEPRVYDQRRDPPIGREGPPCSDVPCRERQDDGAVSLPVLEYDAVDDDGRRLREVDREVVAARILVGDLHHAAVVDLADGEVIARPGRGLGGLNAGVEMIGGAPGLAAGVAVDDLRGMEHGAARPWRRAGQVVAMAVGDV